MLAMSWPPRLDISASSSSSAAAVNQLRYLPLIADVVLQMFTKRPAALEAQRRIHLVGAAVDPAFQRLAAGLGNAACISVPYFTITTSQPKLRNMDSNFSHKPSRTTASRLWRL